MASVAQLVELQIVDLAVAGSSHVTRPNRNRKVEPMHSFRLAQIGLFIVAGALGCTEADPWVGEWRVVGEVEALGAQYFESMQPLLEKQQRMKEAASQMTEAQRIESGLDKIPEPMDLERDAKFLEAKLRQAGKFLTLERGRDGLLVAVFEIRGAEDPARDVRMLSVEVMESSELIRCKFLDEKWGVTITYELKLTSEDLLEGSFVLAAPELSQRESVKLERVR